MSPTLADAEKLPGSRHWSIYDGRGGVYRARRDPSSGWWSAILMSWSPAAKRLNLNYSRRTLREVRAAIAADAV